MFEPPSYTYTFLFTDIESSTMLAQQYSQAMPSLLAHHHSILTEAITRYRGKVFRIIGDAFCAAFETVGDALHAAIAAQHQFQNKEWSPTPLKVRMGLHTGTASPGDLDARDGGFSGYLTLTRAQRIMSVAHGGQILLSSASMELLREQHLEGITFRDLGEHLLKGLEQPDHLWQVISSGLIADFPPLVSQATIPNNLFVPLTSFIGRDREINEIKSLLNHNRLVTLTGPGGSGKTRLSIKIGEQVLEQFSDGAWLIEFAPLADPLLVPQTVAAALGVREQPALPILAQLMEYLRSKNLLLVLDNCEHLVEACAQLAENLLYACPNLRLLATSREALGIPGEIAYPVPPLKIPGWSERLPPAQLMEYESVRLFVERAQTAQPRFVMSDSNAPAIAQICRRLDGIPLAIELAAARIKVFTSEQIADRLDDRFRLLTGGSRTALPRQQTLRGLIEWSYDLLSQEERILLRRLSVFAGGWTIEASEYICAQNSIDRQDNTLDILDALAQLVNKSLVVAVEQKGENHYNFLETIRQFAYEKLTESGESGRLHLRHLEYYLSLAQKAELQLHGPEQLAWFDLLDSDVDNFRAAFDWALKNGQIEKALELSGAIWWFWYIRDHYGEALERMSAALALAAISSPNETRLKVMNGLGFLRYAAGKIPEARAVLEEVVRLGEKLGNRRRLAEALQYLALVEFIAASKTNAEHLEKVRNIAEQSLSNWQALGDRLGISWSLNALASVAQADGDLARARALFEESVELVRSVGDWFPLAYTLRRLAEVALQQGDFSAAEASYREGYSLLAEAGGRASIAANLAGFAALAQAQGQIVRAVRLSGAVDAILHSLAWRLVPIDREIYDRDLAQARGQLGNDVFNAVWDEGQAFSMEQAVAYALSREK